MAWIKKAELGCACAFLPTVGVVRMTVGDIWECEECKQHWILSDVPYEVTEYTMRGTRSTVSYKVGWVKYPATVQLKESE